MTSGTDIPAAPPEAKLSTRQLFFTVFPSIMLPMFIAMSDQTIVASALPSIAAALGEVERVSWTVIAYLIAVTLAAPVYGYLGDIYGRRRFMFIALGIYICACIGCTLAPSIWVLAGTRFLQGLGGGGLMVLSQALIGEAVPPRQRGQFQGYLAGIAVTASAFGPIAGAFMTDLFGWRAVFLLHVPTAMIAFALTMRLKARPGNHQAGWQFDFPGLIFFTGVVVPILLAMDQVRAFDVARRPLIITLLVVAIVSFAFLMRREFSTPSPLLPVRLLRQAAIWRADLMAACHGATLVSLVAFMPLYLRAVHQASAGDISTVLLAITAGVGSGSIVTGRIVTRTGKTMIVPSISLMFTSISLVVFALYGQSFSTLQLAFLLWFNCFTMGSVMGVAQVTVQTAAGPKQLGQASSSVQLSRSIGASLGTATISTILFATLATRDPEAAKLFGAILQDAHAALADLSPARRLAVTDEVASAFRVAFLTLSGITTIGSILAWTNPMRRV